MKPALVLINKRVDDPLLKYTMLKYIKDPRAKYDSVNEMLLYAFIWVETEEGFIFWDNIYRSFRILNL